MATPDRLPDLSLWSPRWNQERLNDKELEDRRSFAQGFRMLPYQDDEKAFPSVTQCYHSNLVLGEILRAPWVKVMGVDLAGTKRPGNFITVVALEPTHRRRVLIAAQRGKWSSPETAKRIAKLNEDVGGCRVILVEDNAYQSALVDWMRQMKLDCWPLIRPFTTTGPKKVDPALGVKSLEVEFSNNAWIIPTEWESHEVGCQCGWCTIKVELEDYPMASSTDGVMSLWFCRQGIDIWSAPSGGATVEGLNVR
uniref:Terminase n=1 Tax=viral metagenome TaxID=1070528 RepID=A0A6H1Z825_9ZZZZ